MITDSGQDKTTGSHHCFKGDHVNMYIVKKADVPLKKKYIFIPGLKTKISLYFLHLEWEGV